jgi:hypothetical protein
MITRVMIELKFDESVYADRRELESLVIDELSDLMRSDILAGARVDLVDTISGTMAVITND